MKRAFLLSSLLFAACGEAPERHGQAHDAGDDGSTPDASGTDALDAGERDAQADGQVETCNELPVPDDCPETTGNALPQELRCTGLYADFATRKVACGVRPYAPAYQLWSDAADKQRYLWLPPGTQIDVSHPDAFVFPEGTRLWKEFRIVDGEHKRLGETRLLVKRKDVWSSTTYVWSPDERTATQTNTGVMNLDGTGHTVPTRDQCTQCHAGRADFVLGFDPIMLGPSATGLTMQSLFDQQLITSSSGALAPDLLRAEPPGSPTERAALGYLHANCGVSCHSQEPFAEAEMSGLDLRLEHGEYQSVSATDAFRTAINQAHGMNAQLPAPVPQAGYLRVRPMDPLRSLLLARMKVRGMEQMPRIGTNRVDDSGVAAVQTWIEQMTPERGYPAPAP